MFITHKLREVREIADKITVIRHGKVVGTARPTDSESTWRNSWWAAPSSSSWTRNGLTHRRATTSAGGRLGGQPERRAGGARS